MSRLYTVGFDDSSVTTNSGAAQDLLLLSTGASNPIRIHEIQIEQRGLSAWEAKPLRFYAVTGAPTITGGTALTLTANDRGNTVSAATTAKSIMTTAFSGGTSALIRSNQFMILNGFFYLPAPEDRIEIKVSSYFIVQLPTPLSGNTTMSLSCVFEEFG